MATVKEAVPFQSSETLGQEQNSFVLFIDQNRDLFERHTSSTYELRDEEEGWKNSPTIDEMAHRHLLLAVPIGGRPNVLPPSSREWKKHSKKVKDVFIQAVFGSRDERNNLTEKRAPLGLILAKATLAQRAEMEGLVHKISEFQANFRGAIAPLAAEVEKSKAELLSNFRDYLLSDPDSIFAFRDFLLDKKYAPSRETIRPFLASLHWHPR